MKTKPQFTSIRSRLLFWTLLVSLLPLGITSVVIYKQRVQVIKENGINKLVAIRDLKVSALKLWLAEKNADIHIIAENHEVSLLETILNIPNHGKDERVLKENVRKVFEQDLSHFPDYEEIFLLNPASGNVEISTDTSQEERDRSQDTFFTETMRTGKDYIDNIYYSKRLKIPFLMISVPIFGLKQPDKITGIIVARVGLHDSLYKLLDNRIGMGKTGETLIINREGFAINSLRWKKGAPLTLTIKAQPAMNAIQGKTGVIEAEDYRGEKVVAAYTYIPQLQWGFVAKQDAVEVFSSIEDLMYNIVILFFIMVLAISLSVVILTNFMSGRIKELDKAAAIIANGDLTQKISIQGSDEIGTLASSINAMVRKLTRSIKELEAFSYSVSHDLRAPLRAIDGFSQILLEDYESKLDKEGKDSLNEIRGSVSNMNELIDGILRLSRISRKEILLEPCDLGEFARSIEKELEISYPKHTVEFHAENECIVFGDKALLMGLLQNLLGNAWKFTSKKKGATIEFGSFLKNHTRTYYVKDNGVGFDMAYADKLFAPFQRLHSLEEFHGTGIGLANAQRIIDRHNGRIWAKGEVGKGTTIYFTLSRGGKDDE